MLAGDSLARPARREIAMGQTGQVDGRHPMDACVGCRTDGNLLRPPRPKEMAIVLPSNKLLGFGRA